MEIQNDSQGPSPVIHVPDGSRLAKTSLILALLGPFLGLLTGIAFWVNAPGIVIAKPVGKD